MLLVWRRNLSSVCRVSNGIPGTETPANPVGAENVAFVEIMYTRQFRSVGYWLLVIDVCGTGNACVKMGKECLILV
jgi:hypothetical protein